MEKKIKALIVIALIAGAGVAVGVTAGIIMFQQGAMDQILLLLAIRPPVTVPRMWTWVSGNDTGDQNGTYGTIGVPAADNIPGSRWESISWMDADDNLWLFGGSGYDSAGSLGLINDLWMFNITSGWWLWVSGNDTIHIKGTYGTKDVPAAENVPGARTPSVTWMDADDNLWLFGGYGYDSAGSPGRLNDLWMFNITSGWWTWVSGNDTGDQNGTYGTIGVPAAENVPGARVSGVSWKDADDNLWLFGGSGWDSAGNKGVLNDLWMFDITSGWWTWVSGNNTAAGIKGTYGTKGVPAAENVPGARYYSVSWTDADDNFWLFGGAGYDSAGNPGLINDLWMFDITSGWWTWVSGSDTVDQNGTYGTIGVPAAGNVPGARQDSVSWTDADDNLWLFGGLGFDSAGNLGRINDLWKY